jgi:hypothetical protein
MIWKTFSGSFSSDPNFILSSINIYLAATVATATIIRTKLYFPDFQRALNYCFEFKRLLQWLLQR